MKKIALILILILSTIKVDALEYGVWTDEVSSDEHSRVVVSETRYRWYKDSAVISPDYYFEGENDNQYPYISYNDVIYTDWSGWSDIYPGVEPNRSIQYQSVSRYRTIRSVRYLFIADLTTYTSITRIPEINVLINGVEIPISVTCTMCSSIFDKLATDGYITGGTSINDGGIITIDLGGYFDINEIGLEMFMYDDVGDTKIFNVYYNEGNTIADRNYVRRYVYVYVGQKPYYEASRFYVIPDEVSITNPIYNDWVYVDNSVEPTYYRQAEITNLYRYKDIKYRYYKVERSYLNGYYNNIEDLSYTKDEGSAKTYFLYEYVEPIDSESPSPPDSDDEDSNSTLPPASDNDDPVAEDPPDKEEDETPIINDPSDGKDETPSIEDSLPDENAVEQNSSSDQEKNTPATGGTSEYLEKAKDNDVTNDISNNFNNQVDDQTNNSELDEISISESEVDNHKPIIQKEKVINTYINNFIKYVQSKMLIISIILVFLTVIVLFKIRHHILSHQN